MAIWNENENGNGVEDAYNYMWEQFQNRIPNQIDQINILANRPIEG